MQIVHILRQPSLPAKPEDIKGESLLKMAQDSIKREGSVI